MRICFVGPANSSHIVKWSNWFLNRGHEIHVVSFTQGEIPGVTVHLIDTGADAGGSDLGKLKYLTTGKKIKKLVNTIQPDIVSAHYATSYGIALALSGLKKYTLSVWGTDIYVFPRKSFLHKALLKHSLKKAPHLFSTSRAMAEEAAKYTKKSFDITPFGVNMELFNPDKRTRPKYSDDEELVIGTVKTLSWEYGIEDILTAASILKKEGMRLSIRIAGKGPKQQEYQDLAKSLGIEDITHWLGYISQEQAAAEWANMDIGVIPSVSESFGVSAVEAQACGTPVIISDIPGLMEATDPDRSSLVVHKKSPEEIAEKIRILSDSSKRRVMGEHGASFVREHYELDDCFEKIQSLFELYRG